MTTKKIKEKIRNLVLIVKLIPIMMLQVVIFELYSQGIDIEFEWNRFKIGILTPFIKLGRFLRNDNKKCEKTIRKC